MAERAPVRDDKLLSYLDRRNRLIPELIAKDEVYRPRTKFGRFLSWFLAERCISPDSVFTGLGNLEQAIKAYARGATMAVASNHESDADHTIRRIGMTRNGYGQYADKIVYAAGLKMRERWYVNPFSTIENQLYIPTPWTVML